MLCKPRIRGKESSDDEGLFNAILSPSFAMMAPEQRKPPIGGLTHTYRSR